MFLYYIEVFNSGNVETPNIQKPNNENINELLEYQQLYDLNIDIAFEKIKDESKKTSESIIEEIITLNKNGDKNNPIIPQQLQTYMTNVRANIPNLSKERAYMCEAILEKISADILNTNYFCENKKKPGRPKKVKEESFFNSKIDDIFNKSNNQI